MGQSLDPGRTYRRLVTIRRCEEALARVFDQGLSFGTVHLCIGQEAVPVGVVSALGPDDPVTSNHRGHGHFLARTDDVEGLVAEVLGRETGVVGGWGGSQHLHAPGFYSNGVTGGMAPVATGMALAERELDTERVVVAFFGDGALGQGVVYESWNLAALWRLPIVYVVEDNRYAMSTPVAEGVAGEIAARPAAFGLHVREVDGQDAEAVHAAAGPLVDRARRGDGAGLLLCRTYRQCGHSRSDRREYRTREEEEAWAARDPLGLAGDRLPADERSRIDDEVDARVEAAVAAAMDAPYPSLGPARVATLQGYPDADAAPPDPPHAPDEAPSTYQQAIRDGLEVALGEQPRALLLGEDLEDPYGGAFKVTRGLSSALPGRVRNTPLSEAALTGLAGGAALRGLRPIVEIMFSDFLTVACDQLVNHAAKFRAMYDGSVTVPLVVRTPAGGWRGYGATHSQCMERLLLGVPGLTLVSPGLHHDPIATLRAAVAHDGPVVVVEHKLLYPRRLIRPEDLTAQGLETWSSDGTAFPTRHISNGPRGSAEVTVVAYGAVVERVREALERLDRTWELVVPCRLRPLPLATLVRAAVRSGRLAVVEEGPTPWGWGAEVAAAVGEAAFEALAAPILRVGATDLPIANSRPLEEALLPTADGVLEALLELLE